MWFDVQVYYSGVAISNQMFLSSHTSACGMDVFLAVDTQIPSANNAVVGGRFFSKVYEGSFKETGNWCKDFEKAVKQKDLSMSKWFM